MGSSTSKVHSLVELPQGSPFIQASGTIVKGEGKGKLVHMNGKVYKGRIKEFMPNGQGKWYDKKKRLIEEGYYRNGLAHGPVDVYNQGILTFHGIFKDGLANGEGTEYRGARRPLRSGLYVNGLRTGSFKEYRDAGDVTVVYPLSFSIKEKEETNGRLKCSICLDKEISQLVKPCNHLCLCKDCSQNPLTNCPLCRTPIQGFVQVFF